MSIFFIDTSSLGKRYVQEIGSQWLSNLLKPSNHHVCIISELTLVEAISMFEKYRRTGAISEPIANLLRYQFLKHARDEYLIVPINSNIMITAQKLVVKHRSNSLRALDAIQLATALQIKSIFTQSITFVASDNKLLNSAKIEKFSIDNPLLHP